MTVRYATHRIYVEGEPTGLVGCEEHLADDVEADRTIDGRPAEIVSRADEGRVEVRCDRCLAEHAEIQYAAELGISVDDYRRLFVG